ncbi:unnamed protein product, partial [Cyprideis torosa]
MSRSTLTSVDKTPPGVSETWKISRRCPQGDPVSSLLFPYSSLIFLSPYPSNLHLTAATPEELQALINDPITNPALYGPIHKIPSTVFETCSPSTFPSTIPENRKIRLQAAIPSQFFAVPYANKAVSAIQRADPKRVSLLKEVSYTSLSGMNFAFANLTMELLTETKVRRLYNIHVEVGGHVLKGEICLQKSCRAVFSRKEETNRQLSVRGLNTDSINNTFKRGTEVIKKLLLGFA